MPDDTSPDSQRRAPHIRCKTPLFFCIRRGLWAAERSPAHAGSEPAKVGSTMANERQADHQTGLDGLASNARKAGGKGPPPVHLWNPPFCGDLDMRIATDGTWHYLKTPIGRPAMVKLFASVLKREGDQYF